ncbi:MAG: hypothetical protein ACM31O_03660 [Bacteroidota bacterium]
MADKIRDSRPSWAKNAWASSRYNRFLGNRESTNVIEAGRPTSQRELERRIYERDRAVELRRRNDRLEDLKRHLNADLRNVVDRFDKLARQSKLPQASRYANRVGYRMLIYADTKANVFAERDVREAMAKIREIIQSTGKRVDAELGSGRPEQIAIAKERRRLLELAEAAHRSGNRIEIQRMRRLHGEIIANRRPPGFFEKLGFNTPAAKARSIIERAAQQVRRQHDHLSDYLERDISTAGTVIVHSYERLLPSGKVVRVQSYRRKR